jgi:hypothetical protein
MALYPSSRTLSVSIDCPPERVAAFVSDPANLPQWAAAFVRSMRHTAEGWIAETTIGPVGFEFVPANEYGVLDHFARPAPGVEIRVPMRVVPNHTGSEVLFTVFETPDMKPGQFATDVATVERDLQTLKRVLES